MTEHEIGGIGVEGGLNVVMDGDYDFEGVF